VNAPASASSANTQKQITPAFAHPAVTLTVDAVWRDQSSPPSSNIRSVVHSATFAT
jgi:hypothetical protein